MTALAYFLSGLFLDIGLSVCYLHPSSCGPFNQYVSFFEASSAKLTLFTVSSLRCETSFGALLGLSWIYTGVRILGYPPGDLYGRGDDIIARRGRCTDGGA